MANYSTNATALGYRYLVRHFEGNITDAQLQIIRNANLITQAEFERAVIERLPPEGYVPTF